MWDEDHGSGRGAPPHSPPHPHPFPPWAPAIEGTTVCSAHHCAQPPHRARPCEHMAPTGMNPRFGREGWGWRGRKASGKRGGGVGGWGRRTVTSAPYPGGWACPNFLLQTATCWKAQVGAFTERPVGTRSSRLSSHLCVPPSKATSKDTGSSFRMCLPTLGQLAGVILCPWTAGLEGKPTWGRQSGLPPTPRASAPSLVHTYMHEFTHSQPLPHTLLTLTPISHTAHTNCHTPLTLICIHIYSYLHAHTFCHTYTHTLSFMLIHSYTSSHTDTHPRTHINTFFLTRVHSPVHTYPHAHRHDPTPHMSHTSSHAHPNTHIACLSPILSHTHTHVLTP